ncbi:hypothetical protein XELAEV_18027158mg [Xenopus laevis]|uniref:USP domain-containing protein n=1 Tax=Xenopus laevis TaxID=8355 RepID=A0A974CXB7_XENLA|nr:hypothetical protein XELAEV_18027158mg [Xenopus laevis]
MSDSINQALCQYVQPEQLVECSYRCSTCHQMVMAIKTVTVHRPSNVLTLCLNRFDIFSNRKIRKSVAFPECLDLWGYTSEPNGTPILYSLFAVLVHAGTTCNSGHYFCYVKVKNQIHHVWEKRFCLDLLQGNNGNLFKMNDNSVTYVDINIVLKQQAYLLFYIRYVQSRARTSRRPRQPTRPCRRLSCAHAQLHTRALRHARKCSSHAQKRNSMCMHAQ